MILGGFKKAYFRQFSSGLLMIQVSAVYEYVHAYTRKEKYKLKIKGLFPSVENKGRHFLPSFLSDHFL
jgi:hypothetical protein